MYIAKPKTENKWMNTCLCIILFLALIIKSLSYIKYQDKLLKDFNILEKIIDDQEKAESLQNDSLEIKDEELNKELQSFFTYHISSKELKELLLKRNEENLKSPSILFSESDRYLIFIILYFCFYGINIDVFDFNFDDYVILFFIVMSILILVSYVYILYENVNAQNDVETSVIRNKEIFIAERKDQNLNEQQKRINQALVKINERLNTLNEYNEQNQKKIDAQNAYKLIQEIDLLLAPINETIKQIECDLKKMGGQLNATSQEQKTSLENEKKALEEQKKQWQEKQNKLEKEYKKYMSDNHSKLQKQIEVLQKNIQGLQEQQKKLDAQLSKDEQILKKNKQSSNKMNEQNMLIAQNIHENEVKKMNLDMWRQQINEQINAKLEECSMFIQNSDGSVFQEKLLHFQSCKQSLETELATNKEQHHKMQEQIQQTKSLANTSRFFKDIYVYNMGKFLYGVLILYLITSVCLSEKINKQYHLYHGLLYCAILIAGVFVKNDPIPTQRLNLKVTVNLKMDSLFIILCVLLLDIYTIREDLWIFILSVSVVLLYIICSLAQIDKKLMNVFSLFFQFYVFFVLLMPAAVKI